MGLSAQREAALKAARAIAERVKEAGRSFTEDERKEIDGYLETANNLAKQIAEAKEDQARLAAIGTVDDTKASPERTTAKSLGEHAAHHMFTRLAEVKGVRGASVAAPEWKAPTDTHRTDQYPVFTPLLTEVDRTVIRPFTPRLIVTDLLGSGTISGNAISYFVEGAFEGAFTTVAEGAAKPQMHVGPPTTVTDVLKKIAGFIKLTDEMMEDLDFFVSEINNRLLDSLARFEEAQLLSGNGTGTNVLGLLNRSGIQTETRGNASSGDTAADTLFRAMTKVTTGSGLDPDGIVIHPTDYQNLRLAKDSNAQYYGGGYFQGQYGNGGVPEQPPIWGLRTIVSPAVAQGQALVGAFRQGATVYRKGGVRVESTNSHADDFTNNLVTTRAEERVALAVRYPTAFVKTTVTPAAV